MSDPIDNFVYFVRERERVRICKEAGKPAPWTADPILQQYRFCNMRREDDKVTKWVSANWRTPNSTDPDVWFAMAVARHVNLPHTLLEIGYPVPWNPDAFVRAIRRRIAAGASAYNAAYMIRASRSAEWGDKAAYLAGPVLGTLWERRAELRPFAGDTLAGFHSRLERSFGLGSFMAAQVVADTKYVGPLLEAVDWWEFAASGPGSRRGLNRVLGRPPMTPWREQEWRSELSALRERLRPRFASEGIEWSHAQDTQNQCCEFSKYEKARRGEGFPKQRYRLGGVAHESFL